MPTDDFRTVVFSQSEILGIKKNSVQGTEAAGGICQELCWKWMKRLHTKPLAYGTPANRMNGLWKESTVDKAIERHNAASLLSVPQTSYNIPRNAWIQRWGYDRPMVNQWCITGGGLFLAVECPRYQNRKHAISFFTSADGPSFRLLFFDPNRGEYEMGFSRFYKFLPEFLGEHYDAAVDHIVETVVYRIPN